MLYKEHCRTSLFNNIDQWCDWSILVVQKILWKFFITTKLFALECRTRICLKQIVSPKTSLNSLFANRVHVSGWQSWQSSELKILHLLTIPLESVPIIITLMCQFLSEAESDTEYQEWTKRIAVYRARNE